MDIPPYIWRADGGYRPLPSRFHPPTPPPALPYPVFGPMYVNSQYIHFSPHDCPPRIISLPSPPASDTSSVNKSIKALLPPASPPTPPMPPTPPTPPTRPTPPTPPLHENKKKDKPPEDAGKDLVKKKPAAPPSNPNSPPSLRAGTNYMFPPEHTKLHIFNKAARIWEEKYKGKSFDFKIFTVSTSFTPTMVIENVLRKKGDDVKGWAVTEVIERGDGVWSKGTSIEYGTHKAKGSLASMGWTVRRGGSLPPVWVVVHKVEKK